MDDKSCTDEKEYLSVKYLLVKVNQFIGEFLHNLNSFLKAHPYLYFTNISNKWQSTNETSSVLSIFFQNEIFLRLYTKDLNSLSLL